MSRLKKARLGGDYVIAIIRDGVDVDLYKVTPEFEAKYLANCTPNDPEVVAIVEREGSKINIDYCFVQ